MTDSVNLQRVPALGKHALESSPTRRLFCCTLITASSRAQRGAGPKSVELGPPQA